MTPVNPGINTKGHPLRFLHQGNMGWGYFSQLKLAVNECQSENAGNKPPALMNSHVTELLFKKVLMLKTFEGKMMGRRNLKTRCWPEHKALRWAQGDLGSVVLAGIVLCERFFLELSHTLINPVLCTGKHILTQRSFKSLPSRVCQEAGAACAQVQSGK